MKMKLIVLFLIYLVPTISCYAECNDFNVPPPSTPASAGFFLNKNEEYISNMSTVHYCDYCESQCSSDCEQTPQCGSTVLRCIRSVPKSSSKEDSMKDEDVFIFDTNVSVEWIKPTPTLASSQYLPSQVNHQLCLCSVSDVAQCNSSSDEGVYKCIIKGSSVTETLQFTYSVYKLTTVTNTGTTSAPGSNVIITSSSYQTMKASTTLSTIIATTTPKTTTTKTTTNSPSIDTSCSLSSLHVTACPSSNEDSTIPYYSGIGLLATTNLLTLIVLVTGCVYIIHSKKQTKYALGRSRANVTVQSNPIDSLSVINIETEIRNEEYDVCPQEQQQQRESFHPSIDIYSYVVDEDHSTNDNDEYAVPDELFEVKRKGCNPPSVPPPYAGKGIDNVEERVSNGVGASSSLDNLDCLYATIGSKEEEKEQTS